MIFFRAFQHLLPKARAWLLTPEKPLRKLFEGLSGVGADAKEFIDNVWLDIFPQTTRELDTWEQQFGLPSSDLNTQGRRDRLDAEWKTLGGQDPRYFQDALRGAGFDVYVHDWWVPGSEAAVGVSAAATPRNPLQYLERGSPGFESLVECGEPLAQCGEAFAQAGNVLQPIGFALVNKVVETVADILPLCGEAFVECGAAGAIAGDYDQFISQTKTYIVPVSPSSWAYFFYIGGETFPAQATVPEARRDEFENLCLKIGPTQLWLGLLVRFT